MSSRTLTLTDPLYAYLLDAVVCESALLSELRAETLKLPGARMQISPEQGQLMRFLVETLGAKRAIEVGVFTGYSSLCIAQALPKDGQLLACDVNPETTRVARRYWERAGVADRIELRLAPASETLRAVLDEGGAGQFDFIFIDADKGAYPEYYDLALELLRLGGLVAFDNALWGGRVADPSDQDESTVAIRTVVERAVRAPNVSATLVPIGDGLLLGRKTG